MKYFTVLMIFAGATVYAQDDDLPTTVATALPTALPTELPTIPDSTTDCDKDGLDTCLNGVANV